MENTENRAGRGTGTWPVTALNQASLLPRSLSSFFCPLFICTIFPSLPCVLDLKTQFKLRFKIHWTCEKGNDKKKKEKQLWLFNENARKKDKASSYKTTCLFFFLLWISTTTKSDVEKRRVKKREETEWM